MERMCSWPRQNCLRCVPYLGRIPTMAEYMQYATIIDETADDTYRYLNFNEMESYQKTVNV